VHCVQCDVVVLVHESSLVQNVTGAHAWHCPPAVRKYPGWAHCVHTELLAVLQVSWEMHCGTGAHGRHTLGTTELSR
jgi:hypothetical protein